MKKTILLFGLLLALNASTITNAVAQEVPPAETESEDISNNYVYMGWPQDLCTVIQGLTACMSQIDFLALEFCPKTALGEDFDARRMTWTGEYQHLGFPPELCHSLSGVVVCTIDKTSLIEDICPQILKNYEESLRNASSTTTEDTSVTN